MQWACFRGDVVKTSWGDYEDSWSHLKQPGVTWCHLELPRCHYTKVRTKSSEETTPLMWVPSATTTW